MLRQLSRARFTAHVTSHVTSPTPVTARHYSLEVFCKNSKRLQRNRAAANVSVSRETDYLRTEISDRMIERLAFISRQFPEVLDLGSGPGLLEQKLLRGETEDDKLVKSRFGHVTMLDSSEKSLLRDYKILESISEQNPHPESDEVVVKDLSKGEVHPNSFVTLAHGNEEDISINNSLIMDNTYDAVISTMSMHWVNDLPGLLKRINSVLKPDGMFMGAMLGGDTLFELRTSLQLAEMERKGGVSPRVSPLADVKDMGGLLQKAKFNLLTVDVDDVIVSYPDIWALMDDLKSMGEGNAVLTRASSLPRDVLIAADAIYKSLHGEEDGSIPATFRFVYMIGWKDSPNQPKPKERGSATVSLKDVLKE
ncbi:NADH dehydrogenase [ubiquinone] 1 alpha subcomplex assembly factor 5 [Yarrowia sp. C11]|nr:NADH dehydrogenase [ubiquinone] 1 alpha subcomplex assembly factor 5 [Yarrowia sp. E02]KAG5373479.1 NADH dehydrogenase [ubiquinone] 1 alpha subcomplex assembly factor 5 [Yarrowia sp. C11]